MGASIVFFGPEGAGKTTQIHLLVKKLYAKYGSKNVEIISIRDNHLLIPIIVGFLKRLGVCTHFRYGDGHVQVVADVQRVVRDKRIWAVFQFLNLLPIYFVKYYLKGRLQGKMLVLDRFIPDSLGTLASFMDDPNILKSKLGRLYLRLLHTDTCLIFLYAPYEVLTERYGVRKTPIEPRDLISYEMLVGRKISKLFRNVLVINTSEESKIDTNKIIEGYLTKLGIL